MSWQDVLQANPVAESASQYPQYPQYPQKGIHPESFEDIEDIEDRKDVANRRVAELRQKVQRARDWDDLEALLDDIQGAYDAGEITSEELKSLVGYVADRSRQVPERMGQAPQDQSLTALLAERTVVRVRSRLLGEVVVWVADKATVEPDTEEVIYREAELRKLVGRSPAEMRAIHAVKRAVDGEVVVQ
jgi:hypothetical protein